MMKIKPILQMVIKELIVLITPILPIGPVGDMTFVIASNKPPGTTSLSVILCTYLLERNIPKANSMTKNMIATCGATANTKPLEKILGVFTKI